MGKFLKKKNGLLIKKRLPTKSQRLNTNYGDTLDTMFEDRWHKKDIVRVVSVEKKIVTSREKIPKSDSSLGGVVVTGFIDIEKLIELKQKHSRRNRTIFLEKLLPFQILELELEKDCDCEE